MLILLLKLVVLPDNIVAIVKLFADDISIFSGVNDANIFAGELNKGLQKISEWVQRWKMSFITDLRSDFFQKTKQIKSPKNLF